MIEFSASMWMHLSEAHTVLIIFMKFFNNKILKQIVLLWKCFSSYKYDHFYLFQN